MDKEKIMDDRSIIISGIEALNKALGPADAFRFITLLRRDQTDYVEISQRLYEGQTVNDIFERAKGNWSE
jgi:hypothetical protein